MLPKGTKICIDDILYSSKSWKDLFSFKDIRYNGYYIEANNEGNEKYIFINGFGPEAHIRKTVYLSFGLYYRRIETNVTMHQKCPYNPTQIYFMFWHDSLGHLESIMIRQTIENSHGHSLKNQQILLPSDYPCNVCSQGKLIIKPSLFKDCGWISIFFRKNSRWYL